MHLISGCGQTEVMVLRQVCGIGLGLLYVESLGKVCDVLLLAESG